MASLASIMHVGQNGEYSNSAVLCILILYLKICPYMYPFEYHHAVVS